MPTTAEQWIGAYAEALGLEPPSETEVAAILQLAAVAAHSSERRAAPVACWLAATAGVSLDEALALAEALPPAGDGA